MGKLDMETEISVTILPALEDLERLVMKLKSSEDAHGLKDDILQEEIEKKELEIKQLKQKVAVLESERNNMHKRLHDMLNSKSWKVTAPLRLFTERNKIKK